MPLQVKLFLLLIVVSSIVATWVMVFLNRKRDAPGASYLSLMLLTCLIWNIGYFIEIVGRDFDIKMLGVAIQYFGIPFTPVFWFIFVQQYTSHWHAPSKTGIILLLLVPTVTLVLAITTTSHNLFYTDPQVGHVGYFSVITKGQGLWFNVHVYYSYVVLALGTVALYRKYLEQRAMFKMQLFNMLLAVALPWIASILYVAGMHSFMPLDFTNAAFTFSGAFIGYTMFKYKLFELLPQAKEQIFDVLSTAIVVCDRNFYVVEFNKSAGQLFKEKLSIGNTLDSILPENFSFSAIHAGEEFSGEITLGGNTLTLNSSSILSTAGELLGYSIALTDITYQKSIEHGLESLNQTKDKFFSIIAHDLKNPFFGLMGFSNLLVEQIQTMDKAEILQMVKYIQELSGNTYKMLENLLDWARSQTNAIEYNPTVFDLNEIITESLANAEGNAMLKSITFQSLLPEKVFVKADINMIRTVLRNLISNAIKFTPVNGKIELSAFYSE
ncbi:MAG: hypothetical protein HY965_08065, partial [Ignavibacteriales bacterium]|nr:hypothetical protein [Ignavibacteriales bacterium]